MSAAVPGAPGARVLDLSQVSLPRLLFSLLHQRFTGTLVVQQQTPHAGPRTIWFRGGMAVFTDWSEPTEVLGQVLIGQRMLTEDLLLSALETMARQGGLLGQTLMAMGQLSAANLADALRRQCGRKLARITQLRDGAVTVTPLEHTLGTSDGLLAVNGLELILNAISQHYDEARVAAEMGGALQATLQATPALNKYVAHFRFRSTDKLALQTLLRGTNFATVAQLHGMTRNRASQLVFLLWACQMLQVTPGAVAHPSVVAGTYPPTPGTYPPTPGTYPPASGTYAPVEPTAAPAGYPVQTAQPVAPAAASSGSYASRAVVQPQAVPLPQGAPGAGLPPGFEPTSQAFNQTPVATSTTPTPVATPTPITPTPITPTPITPTPIATPIPVPTPRVPPTATPAPPRTASIPPQGPPSTPPPSATKPRAAKADKATPKKRPPIEADGVNPEFAAQLIALEEKIDAGAHAFDLFGLELDATRRDVRRAWGDLSRTFHPDALASLGLEVLRERVSETFAALSEAHQVLADAEQRAELAREIESGSHGASGADATATARAAFEAELVAREGEKLMRSNNFARALERLQAAAEIQTDPGTEASIAWCRFQISDKSHNNAALANTTLQTIVEEYPMIPGPHYYRGFVLIALGHTDLAITEFAEAYKLDPRLIDAERQARALRAKKKSEREASAAPAARKGLRGLFKKK